MAYSLPQMARTKLAAAGNVQTQVLGEREVKITWSDESARETAYRIRRSTSAGVVGGIAGTVAAGVQQFVDTSAQDGKTYYYSVEAYKSVSQSVNVSLATLAPSASVTPLFMPEDVIASNIPSGGSTNIVVSWQLSDRSLNHTGFTINRYPAGVTPSAINLIDSTPVNSASTRSYSFNNQSGSYQFKVITKGANSSESAATEPVVNVYEPTASWSTAYWFESDYTDYPTPSPNPGTPLDYVQNNAHWSWIYDNGVDPPYPESFSADQEYTLELKNLPRHSFAKVELIFDTTWAPDADFNISADTTPLPCNISYANYPDMDWRGGISTSSSPADAFAHSTPEMTLTFNLDNAPTGATWTPLRVLVYTYFPFIELSASSHGTEDGNPAHNANVTVIRHGAIGTVADDPLSVQIKKEYGSAGSDDVSVGDSIEIPGDEYTHTVGIINEDDEPEWTEDFSIALKQNRQQYHAMSTTPKWIEIVDDDLHISDLPEWLYLNDDDDDEDYEPDMDQGIPSGPEYFEELGIDGEDDLHELLLDTPDEIKDGARVTISGPGGKIRIWENQDRSGTLFIGENRSEFTWVIGQDEVPESVWVEAHAGSSQMGDIIVELEATDAYAQTPPVYATQTQAQTEPATNYVEGVHITVYKGSTSDEPLREIDEQGQGRPGWYMNVNWDDDDLDGWSGQGWLVNGTLDPNFNGTLSLNPTYTGDRGDSEVNPAGVTGDNDLWKFQVSIDPGLAGKAKLIFPGNIKVWGTRTKKNANGSSSEIASGTEFNAADLPKTLYAEGINGSSAIKDVKLRAEYVPPQGGAPAGGDEVEVTVFDITWQGFFGDNGLAADQHDDNQKKFTDPVFPYSVSSNKVGMISNDDANGDGLNKVLGDDPNSIYFHNAMELQGTIKPAGASILQNAIEFDLYRQRWTRSWQKNANGWSVQQSGTGAPWIGDDDANDDEDLTPSETNHIYHIDGPGWPSLGRSPGITHRASAANFREIGAVKLYSTWYACSDIYRWHSQIYLVPDGNNFTRGAMDLQELGSGWMALPNLPAF